MIQKTSAAKASFSRLAPGPRQWPKTIPGQANKWRPFGQHTDANAHHLQLGKTRAVKRQNIRAQSDLNCQRGRKHCQWQVGFSGSRRGGRGRKGPLAKTGTMEILGYLLPQICLWAGQNNRPGELHSAVEVEVEVCGPV